MENLKTDGFCNRVATLIGFYFKKFGLRLPWILLGISGAYFIFYLVYLLIANVNECLYEYDHALKVLFQIFFAVFGSGILGAVFRYLQINGLISEEFNKVIDSSNFEKKLAEQIGIITLSDDYLKQRADLDEIWKNITLLKYRQHLPGLGDKLDKIVENKWFKKEGLAYYYKNYQIDLKIEFVEGYRVKITESTTFTIKRESKDTFLWDHTIICDSLFEDKKTIEYEFTVGNLDYNSCSQDIKYSLDTKKEKEYNIETCKAKYELNGHEEYYLSTKATLYQELKSDRMFNFFTDRIIDDLTIFIRTDDELSVVLAPVNGTKLYKNRAFNEFKHAYVNREILLTGEYLKIFIHKNDIDK